VGALALYIEDEGVPTVGLSLVREHTAALKPPRALWVPFMLGRPLGVPDDPAFQQRVVLAALKLFERESGPVLEDFPEDAPASAAADNLEGMVCAVDFGGVQKDATLAELVHAEIGQLRSWYDIAVKRRGRTALGAAGAPVEALVDYVAAYADGKQAAAYRSDIPPANALRLACEEIKSFYFEAIAGQPGTRAPAEVQRWFWHETSAGRLVFALYDALKKSSDDRLRYFAQESLIPRAARETRP
jgi:hypothetical protein